MAEPILVGSQSFSSDSSMQRGSAESRENPLGGSASCPGQRLSNCFPSPGGFGRSPSVSAEVEGWVGLLVPLPSRSTLPILIFYVLAIGECWHVTKCRKIPGLGNARAEGRGIDTSRNGMEVCELLTKSASGEVHLEPGDLILVWRHLWQVIQHSQLVPERV